MVVVEASWLMFMWLYRLLVVVVVCYLDWGLLMRVHWYSIVEKLHWPIGSLMV